MCNWLAEDSSFVALNDCLCCIATKPPILALFLTFAFLTQREDREEEIDVQWTPVQDGPGGERKRECEKERGDKGERDVERFCFISFRYFIIKVEIENFYVSHSR